MKKATHTVKGMVTVTPRGENMHDCWFGFSSNLIYAYVFIVSIYLSLFRWNKILKFGQMEQVKATKDNENLETNSEDNATTDRWRDAVLWSNSWNQNSNHFRACHTQYLTKPHLKEKQNPNCNSLYNTFTLTMRLLNSIRGHSYRASQWLQ